MVGYNVYFSNKFDRHSHYAKRSMGMNVNKKAPLCLKGMNVNNDGCNPL
jgi:hypothetical protein